MPMVNQKMSRKAVAMLGVNESRGPTNQRNLPPSWQDDDEISPWGKPMNSKDIAPWDVDPQPHVAGTRAFADSYFNENAHKDNAIAPFAPLRPTTSLASTTDSHNLDSDVRRPSLVTATTATSVASQDTTSRAGRFRRKNLKGLLGDDPDGEAAAKGSGKSATSSIQNGHDLSKLTPRNNSIPTAKSGEDASKTNAPPSSDVTPWNYQNFEDVSNFGSAPIRNGLTGDDYNNAIADATNGTAAPSSNNTKKGLLHRPAKSKDEGGSILSSINIPSLTRRPSTSREVSFTSTSMANGNSTTDLSSTIPTSNSNRDPSLTTANHESERPSGKRSFLSRVVHRNRDKVDKPSKHQTYESPAQPALEKPPRKRTVSKDKGAEDFVAPSDRDRETSIASADSTSTIKPTPTATEPFPKIDRTMTASSKTSRFHRPSKIRGLSYQSESSDKSRGDKTRGSTTSTQQAPMQAGIFSLDTNFDDMSDIIGTVKPDGSKIPQTPTQELSAPAWDAPDSWAIKGTVEEVTQEHHEHGEEGLPVIQEEDGISYFMRVFRTDGTFATLSMTINATVGEVLQSLAKKSFLHDSIESYQLLLRVNQLSRQLGSNERPIAMQKRLLLAAGYQEHDHIEDIGREDNSYLCRFTFSHEKQTGFGSGLENDAQSNKIQKFNHIDLSGRSLITIPIVLYTKAPEIISLNLSQNLALSIPKDFISACVNLREIKFTGNEAWRLPPSISSATRMTILDISNNRIENLDHAELHRVSGLTSIKLANNRLTDLPAKFSQFRQLRVLNISSNNFKMVPDQICSLKSLVDLDISFNKISSLPSKISQLKTLERLWMTNNDLKGPLPETLKNLSALKEIDARFNKLTNVDAVTTLPNLEQLLVGHNAISTFKGFFQKLRTFVLDHCPVSSFEIEESMPTLSTLNIASANLVEFKEKMFELMPNLQKLNLDKNHFTNISPMIGRLSKLEWLSMAKNKLTSIPPTVGSLTELKYLNLRECNLKTLPSEIWFCKKLETLNMSSNVLESFPKQTAAPPSDPKEYAQATTPGLTSSPSFEELGKLEDFQARRPSQASAGMMSLSSSVGTIGRKNSVTSAATRKMSAISRTNTEMSMSAATRKDSNLSQARLQNTFAGSLRYLYLADNRLEDEIFRELVMLPELRMLNLSYNEIDDFPQGVLRRWPQMTELYLSGNLLTSLPSDDLEDSSNLRTLHLNANRFQVLPAELCNVHKLSTLDVGSNSLKYNVTNWPYDWNWNRNTNLKYLNFSANRRLEIKPATHPNQAQFAAMTGDHNADLTSFNSLKYLRVLGLMDVTLLTDNIPEDHDDRRVRTSASNAGSLVYGMADTLGKNDHLSTLDLVKPNFRGHDAEIVVGLFDGQSLSTSGSKIAKYLHSNFPNAFTTELKKAEKSGDTPEDALRRTFLNLNKDMANFAQSNIDTKEHRLLHGHRASLVANSMSQDDLNTGAVATVLYLNGTDLHVANVGDAEAILIQSTGQHRTLTEKHDPANQNERERIRKAGGYVSRQGKLNDSLEVSRAFGYFSHMPSVIAAPHTTTVSLAENDELIVLASKEFWDHVTVDLAVDIARAEKNDMMFAAQKLRDLAMAFGARDRIMVMVAGVADLRKRGNSRLRGATLNMPREIGQDDGQIFPSSKRGKRNKDGTQVGDSKLARLEEVEAPVGDIAIVFTDIKNSTALWELLPIPMRSGISMHNELMRRQLRIIGGYEVKTEGDAFMCSFPTATSALLWCFSCQSHLLDLPWPPEILETSHCQEKFDADHNLIYRGLSVRMGIHWGAPLCEQDPITRRMDYFGPMVNKSARVSGVADGGQISVSSDFVMELRGTLETFAEDDRRDSIGSMETTMFDDPLADRIRRELRQLSSQGFGMQELGEKKLKGLENAEFIHLMYPHSLAGRLQVPSGAAVPEQSSAAAAEGERAEPGALEKESALGHDGMNLDEIWKLWDLALRLEMLCSCLEDSGREVALRKPELSLLDAIKNKGGIVSDAFLMNLLEHQVTRVEIRHLSRPLRRGVPLREQGRPMQEIMEEIAAFMSSRKQPNGIHRVQEIDA